MRGGRLTSASGARCGRAGSRATDAARVDLGDQMRHSGCWEMDQTSQSAAVSRARRAFDEGRQEGVAHVADSETGCLCLPGGLREGPS